MTHYKPGTVAVATVRGVPNVRVMCYEHDGLPGWCSAEQVKGETDHAADNPGTVTDVRPLVVLDFNGLDVVQFLDDLRGGLGGDLAEAVAGQIDEQTGPPRIPEPGFGSVVEAGRNGGRSRRHFIRAYINPHIGSAPWTDGEVLAKWNELDDPVLVREGVSN